MMSPGLRAVLLKSGSVNCVTKPEVEAEEAKVPAVGPARRVIALGLRDLGELCLALPSRP